MKKALITGITGQDGAYLANLLLEKNYEVFGGIRKNVQDRLNRLKVLKIHERVTFINLDICDQSQVFDAIRNHQFDEIYNLAGQSFVGSSWDLSIPTTSVNSVGVLYLLESIKRYSPHTKFYQASTSEMFGKILKPIQNETTSFYPRSPYGVSKLYSHWMTINYRESFGLRACSGILFNHESPLRGPEFVTKKITTQLCEIKFGSREKLILGNLNAKRDWGYAKEYVKAMWLMLQQDQIEDYVIATGKTTSVREFVSFCCTELEIDLVWEGEGELEKGFDRRTNKLIVECNKEYYRPAEVDILIGSSEKAKKQLGWEAKTDVKSLASIMVSFDRQRLA